jgi:hypothetical protein
VLVATCWSTPAPPRTFAACVGATTLPASTSTGSTHSSRSSTVSTHALISKRALKDAPQQ